MQNGDEITYLEQRARREREVASTSEDNTAALVHLRMADEYERRIAMARTSMPTGGSAV